MVVVDADDDVESEGDEDEAVVDSVGVTAETGVRVSRLEEMPTAALRDVIVGIGVGAAAVESPHWL